MLWAVLRSDRAVPMSIFIIRAFIRLGEIIAHKTPRTRINIGQEASATRPQTRGGGKSQGSGGIRAH